LASTKRPKDEAFSSVLVAVEGRKSDEEAVKLACDLLVPQKGDLFIVYIIEVERGMPLDAEIVPATAKGEEVLKEMEEVAKPYRCAIKAELLQSRKAGLAVVQEAVDKGVDAVVLGTTYRHEFGSFSLGDTVPYVLENAPCKVLLWRDAVPHPQVVSGRF